MNSITQPIKCYLCNSVEMDDEDSRCIIHNRRCSMCKKHVCFKCRHERAGYIYEGKKRCCILCNKCNTEKYMQLEENPYW